MILLLVVLILVFMVLMYAALDVSSDADDIAEIEAEKLSGGDYDGKER